MLGKINLCHGLSFGRIGDVQKSSLENHHHMNEMMLEKGFSVVVYFIHIENIFMHGSHSTLQMVTTRLGHSKPEESIGYYSVIMNAENVTHEYASTSIILII